MGLFKKKDDYLIRVSTDSAYFSLERCVDSDNEYNFSYIPQWILSKPKTVEGLIKMAGEGISEAMCYLPYLYYLGYDLSKYGYEGRDLCLMMDKAVDMGNPRALEIRKKCLSSLPDGSKDIDLDAAIASGRYREIADYIVTRQDNLISSEKVLSKLHGLADKGDRIAFMALVYSGQDILYDTDEKISRNRLEALYDLIRSGDAPAKALAYRYYTSKKMIADEKYPPMVILKEALSSQDDAVDNIIDADSIKDNTQLINWNNILNEKTVKEIVDLMNWRFITSSQFNDDRKFIEILSLGNEKAKTALDIFSLQFIIRDGRLDIRNPLIGGLEKFNGFNSLESIKVSDDFSGFIDSLIADANNYCKNSLELLRRTFLCILSYIGMFWYDGLCLAVKIDGLSDDDTERHITELERLSSCGDVRSSVLLASLNITGEYVPKDVERGIAILDSRKDDPDFDQITLGLNMLLGLKYDQSDMDLILRLLDLNILSIRNRLGKLLNKHQVVADPRFRLFYLFKHTDTDTEYLQPMKQDWGTIVSEYTSFGCLELLMASYNDNPDHQDLFSSLESFSAENEQGRVLIREYYRNFSKIDGGRPVIFNPFKIIFITDGFGDKTFREKNNDFIDMAPSEGFVKWMDTLCEETGKCDETAISVMTTVAMISFPFTSVWRETTLTVLSHIKETRKGEIDTLSMVRNLADGGDVFACTVMGRLSFDSKGKDVPYSEGLEYLDKVAHIPHFKSFTTGYANILSQMGWKPRTMDIYLDVLMRGIIEKTLKNPEMGIRNVYSWEMRERKDKMGAFLIGISYFRALGIGPGDLAGFSAGSIMDSVFNNDILSDITKKIADGGTDRATDALCETVSVKLDKKQFIEHHDAHILKPETILDHIFNLARSCRKKSPNGALVYGMMMNGNGKTEEGIKWMMKAKKMGCIYADEKLALLADNDSGT